MKKYVTLLILTAFFITSCDLGIINPETDVENTEKAIEDTLPSKVDNSQNKYFRGIITQLKNSCSHASPVAYIYTYEINFLRDLDSKAYENKYPSHWSYNFVNNGDIEASNVYEAVNVIKDAGVPTAEYYGTELGFNAQRWVSGYQVYYEAMCNRVKDIEEITLTTKEGLEKAKWYLYNHGTSSSTGGILSYVIAIQGTTGELPSESSEAGKKIATLFKHETNHVTTIVGYDDTIKYDYNGDGKFTDNIDLNGDNIIDLFDNEIGAFKIAESHGENSYWTDRGFYYISYGKFALECEKGGAGEDAVKIITPIIDYTPKMTLKIELYHSSRNQIKIFSGMSLDQTASEPEFTKYYYHLQNRGGALPIAGDTNDPIEIGLDLTELYNQLGNDNEATFFLGIKSDGGTGTINNCTLIDYENNQEFPVKNAQGITTGDNFIKIEYTRKL